LNKDNFEIIIIIGYREGEHYPLEVITDERLVDNRYEYWEKQGYEVSSESRTMEAGIDKNTGDLIWLN